MEEKKAAESIFEMILDNVPENFVRKIAEITPILYQEAFERAFNDPAWGPFEARYILPHQRRVLFEAQFRTIAGECGLLTTNRWHAGRNCNYTAVRAGRIVCTASAVESESAIARPAVSRRQHAAVNYLLQNPTFSFIDTAEVFKADTIYAMVTHGPDQVDLRAVGFLNIGIPAFHTGAWVEHYPLSELIRGYNERKKTHAQLEEVQDRVSPQVRKRRKGGSA